MSERRIDLEQILKDTLNCHKPWELEIRITAGTPLSDIIAAMKEACRQTLELAAENAKIQQTWDYGRYEDNETISPEIKILKVIKTNHPGHGDCTHDIIRVNRQSILDSIKNIE